MMVQNIRVSEGTWSTGLNKLNKNCALQRCLQFTSCIFIITIIIIILNTVKNKKTKNRTVFSECVPPTGVTRGHQGLTVSRDKLSHGGGDSPAALHKLDLGDDDVVLQNRATAGAHGAAPGLVHIDVRASARPAQPGAHGGQRCGQEISCGQEKMQRSTLLSWYLC